MSDDRIDPETLAAFLDGTATPEERDGVFRTLAHSKEAHASFLEAAAIHRELSAETPDVTPGAGASAAAVAAEPPRPSAQETAHARWFRRWHLLPVVIAAGLAAILLARNTRNPGSSAAIQLAQATRLTRTSGSGTLGRALGETWAEPPWSTVRGAESTMASRRLAFRAGVRYAELEAAAQASDTTAVARSAELLAQLLSSTEGAAPIAANFRDLGGSAEFGGRSERAASAGQLRELLGAGDWFDLGVWTETARLAAAARETSFFDAGGRGVATLRRIVGSGGGDAGPVTDELRPFLAGRTWSPDDMADAARAINAAMTAAAR